MMKEGACGEGESRSMLDDLSSLILISVETIVFIWILLFLCTSFWLRIMLGVMWLTLPPSFFLESRDTYLKIFGVGFSCISW
jgi:hypothetical protein